MAIISLKAALDTLLACLNHFPLFALMLRIKDSQRLPGILLMPFSHSLLMKSGGIRFELRDTQQLSGRSPDAHAAPPTSYIFLKVSKPPSVELSPSDKLQSVPLTFRAIFHQYFQLGHRIRKHYLSPRVLLCLATGKFVPPIHRKNLYSLQYSMLPAHRAGITEMWHALTAQTPAKRPGLYDNLKVNGKRLNSNGRRHYGH